jgi:hypothetical protein
MKKGRYHFIVIEGGDGSGKGTQAELLNEYFKYVKDPESWPFQNNTLKGKILKLFFASQDKLEKPYNNDWPSNLYYLAGEYCKIDVWKKYAAEEMIGSSNIIMYPKIYIEEKLLDKVWII